MRRKIIQEELNNFQNLLGRKGIYFVRYQLSPAKKSFANAEKPLMMQKRHLILAETFNKCVMFGGNQFQLWPYCRMECPTVPLSEQHWSLMLATELSEVFVMIVTGAGAITDGQQGRESKLGNQLRTAQLNTRPGMEQHMAGCG